MRQLTLVLVALLLATPVCADESVTMPATHILDLNDADASAALKAMALVGDNHAKLLAEAWIVLSSIAMGQGRARCGFDDETAKTMWVPALDGMTKDEIYELNRVVTSNFRNAETGSVVDKRKLFPISRQSVLLLTDRSGRWDCNAIVDLKNRSATYVKNGRKSS